KIFIPIHKTKIMATTGEGLSEEDEHAYTLQLIIDMLIAAGYFRARIKGLDAFDKVAGGMAWAIRASGVPIEVEVQFKENASIGEKLHLCEQLVQALIEMKCPAAIEPHQIQGLHLGCLPIFPVVQWLVKAVIDYRKMTGDSVRNYSTFLFDVDFVNNSVIISNKMKSSPSAQEKK
ncbi:hypothetical protein RFI_00015, partial [Reticulomyxa filosa]